MPEHADDIEAFDEPTTEEIPLHADVNSKAEEDTDIAKLLRKKSPAEPSMDFMRSTALLIIVLPASKPEMLIIAESIPESNDDVSSVRYAATVPAFIIKFNSPHTSEFVNKIPVVLSP